MTNVKTKPPLEGEAAWQASLDWQRDGGPLPHIHLTGERAKELVLSIPGPNPFRYLAPDNLPTEQRGAHARGIPVRVSWNETDGWRESVGGESLNRMIGRHDDSRNIARVTEFYALKHGLTQAEVARRYQAGEVGLAELCACWNDAADRGVLPERYADAPPCPKNDLVAPPASMVGRSSTRNRSPEEKAWIKTAAKYFEEQGLSTNRIKTRLLTDYDVRVGNDTLDHCLLED